MDVSTEEELQKFGTWLAWRIQGFLSRPARIAHTASIVTSRDLTTDSILQYPDQIADPVRSPLWLPGVIEEVCAQVTRT